MEINGQVVEYDDNTPIRDNRIHSFRPDFIARMVGGILSVWELLGFGRWTRSNGNGRPYGMPKDGECPIFTHEGVPVLYVLYPEGKVQDYYGVDDGWTALPVIPYSDNPHDNLQNLGIKAPVISMKQATVMLMAVLRMQENHQISSTDSFEPGTSSLQDEFTWQKVLIEIGTRFELYQSLFSREESIATDRLNKLLVRFGLERIQISSGDFEVRLINPNSHLAHWFELEQNARAATATPTVDRYLQKLIELMP
ncbi:MAG: hypothetical protein ACTSUI_06015 [Promethearchaeota archaeon]